MHFHVQELGRRPADGWVVRDTCAPTPEAALLAFDAIAWLLVGTGWTAGCDLDQRGERWLMTPKGHNRRFGLRHVPSHGPPRVRLQPLLPAGVKP